MDIMDKVTPISGDYKELIPPYIGTGHSGRTLSLNRTEKVKDSNINSKINPRNIEGCQQHG